MVTLPRIAIVLLGLATAIAGPAAAQDYPTKPIRVLVGYAAGGFTDLFGRVVAEELSTALKQQAIVENRTGAGGVIAIEAARNSPPDGYTLLVASPPHVINAALQPNAPYHPWQDFKAIILVASTPSLLVAHPSVPGATVKELVEHIRANPGKLNYASSSVGASSHLAMELLKREAGGLDITHVPYRGSAAAATDLLAGRVQLAIDNVVFYAPHVKEGKLRAIATIGRERSELLPDVPTFAEAGFPSFDAQAWYMMLAPANTPDAIIARLNAALMPMVGDPKVRQRLTGAQFIGSTPTEADAYLRQETEKWGKVVREANIKPE